jgi:hypothetical protein
VIILLRTGQFLNAAIPMIVLASVSLFMWKRNIIGGADAKILPCILPYLASIGLSTVLVEAWFFLIFLAIVGGLYGLIGKFVLKEYPPFVPAITLSFVFFWAWKFVI